MAKPRKNSSTAAANNNSNTGSGAGGDLTPRVKPKRTRKSVSRESARQRSSVYRGVTRHRWTGRFEAHLWDKNSSNESQNKKGKQGRFASHLWDKNSWNKSQNKKGKQGATPPVAINGCGSLVVVRLLDHDVNPNREDSYGSTPLRIDAISELLLSRGAYADPQWESGSPLYIAPQYGTHPNNVLDTRRNAPLLIGMELPVKNLVLHEDDEPQYETEGDATCGRMFVGGVKRSFQNAETKWVLDSGSSYHITGNKYWLKRTSGIDGNRQLQFSVASGTQFCPTHEGDIRTDEIKLSGVYFTEGCSMNIISAGMLECQGLQIDFGDGKFTVRNPESSALVGEGYLDTQGMRYIVNYLKFKKKYISEAGSPQEIPEAATVIAPEEGVETTQNLKRKREMTEAWIVDSGNAHHLTSTLDDMMKLHSVAKSKISLDTPFGQKIKIIREGNKRSSTVRLNRVWYSPDIAHNLISVPQLDVEGYRVRLLSGICTVWYKKKPEAVGTALCDAGNHLYYIRDFRAVSQEDQKKYA